MKHARKLLPIVALLLSALVIPVHTASAEVRYTMTVIQGLTPDAAVMPYGINSSGQVVGGSQQSGIGQAFLWDGSHSINLGTLPGKAQAGAVGINDLGDIVGASGNNANGSDMRAFLYSGGQMQDLGVLPGFTASQGVDINDSGQIVGACSSVGSGTTRGFFYSNGQMVPLKDLLGGTQAIAAAINNLGQIGGTSITAAGQGHAAVFSGESAIDLGTLGGAWSVSSDINDLGQVVGQSERADAYRQAFLYTDGHMIDIGALLGTTQSSAVGLNNLGEVVGNCWVGSTGHAFFYSNGAAVDLNNAVDLPAGWVLTGAGAINDAGQITATGNISGRDSFACLLTPVPEPLSVSCLSIGLFVLASKRTRRP